ncbi:hypothetical protein VIRA109638_13755 [Vibrio rarus]
MLGFLLFFLALGVFFYVVFMICGFFVSIFGVLILGFIVISIAFNFLPYVLVGLAVYGAIKYIQTCS